MLLNTQKVQANMQESRALSPEFTDFEKNTRNLRWLAIAMVVLTFPAHAAQAPYIYMLMGIWFVYNLCQYVPAFRAANKDHASITSLLVDNLFTGLLIALLGSISTPYSSLLVVMIIIGSYLYQIKGLALVAALQLLVLFAAMVWPLFGPIVLSPPRLLAITIFSLVILGLLVARLSGGDRHERALLQQLRQRSDQERIRLRSLVNTLDFAVFVTDHKGIILHHNEAARLLTLSNHEMVNQELFKALNLHSRSKPQNGNIDLLRGTSEPQRRRDLNVVLEDGATVDLDISVTPVRLADGNFLEYIVVCEDVTKERSLDEQRSEFISVASHELRTPLAILEGALETVLYSKQKLVPEIKDLIEQAHRNALLLAGIVKDITMLAEAKNDNLPVHLTKINPKLICDSVMNDFAAQAKQKGIKLEVVIGPDTDSSVLSTENYIHEVLQNFMTNALKYSRQGTIKVAAKASKNGGIIFSVTDQGIGIAPKDQKLLFTKFFRAEDYRTRTTGGSGLGLYLCMEIAQRLGARIWCKSVLNEGSTFFLAIPAYSSLKRDQREVVQAQVANLIDGL